MATENSGKYYYLKLKDDFFDREEIKVLESMPDGFLYSNILMKLYLRSLKNNGRLMLRNVLPYTPQIIASVTGHPVGVVIAAIEQFKTLELIEILDNGAVYMLDVENFVGQSSTEADRVRAYRAKIEAEKRALLEQKAGELPDEDVSNVRTNVRQENENARDPESAPEVGENSETLAGQGFEETEEKPAYKCTPEKESRDKRKENKKNTTSVSGETHKELFIEIIAYLNFKTGKNFKPTTKETQQHIRARLNEGYTLEDFKQVIDTKVAKWGRDAKMVDFLRPRTLFSSNFESYLNETPPAPAAAMNSQHNAPSEDYGNIPEWAVRDRQRQETHKQNVGQMTQQQRAKFDEVQSRFGELNRKRLGVFFQSPDEDTAELTEAEQAELEAISDFLDTVYEVNFWQLESTRQFIQ